MSDCKTRLRQRQLAVEPARVKATRAVARCCNDASSSRPAACSRSSQRSFRRKRTRLRRFNETWLGYTRHPRKSIPNRQRLMYGSGFRPRDNSRSTNSPIAIATRRQPGAIFTPDDEVIHVPHVAAGPESLLDEPIEPAQVEVGEVLRGQAADRHPAARRDLVTGDDPAEQIEQTPVLELPPQPPE